MENRYEESSCGARTPGHPRPAFDGVEIRQVEDEDELDLLEPLWISSHRLHREMLPPGTVIADDTISWRRRRERYRQ